MSRETRVICDRCGKVAEVEHPDRVTIATHRYEEYTDFGGRKHVKSIYGSQKPMHFCIECTRAFKQFLNEFQVDDEQLQIDFDI